jgi:hypothetical protein
MLFRDYKANFDQRRVSLRLPPGKSRPAMPPWIMDWAVLYPDGMHFRVKETYRPALPPLSAHGERLHFCYQYGATTGTDRKGMPHTLSDADTVIRLDQDQFGPHMHYKNKNHVKQEALTGKLILADAEVFAFIEAVETHRMSGSSFEDILFFELKRGSKR